MEKDDLTKKLLKYFADLEERGELPLSLENFDSRIWVDFSLLGAHDILPVVGKAIELGLLKGRYYSNPQEGTQCTVNSVTPKGQLYLETNPLPPALKQLAENSPEIDPDRFRCAVIIYLGALGQTLAELYRKDRPGQAEELLERLRAMIELSVPLKPDGRGAYRQHVLILHQLVVEGYKHVDI